MLAALPEDKTTAVVAALSAPEPNPGFEVLAEKIAMVVEIKPLDARRLMAAILAIYDCDAENRIKFFDDLAETLGPSADTPASGSESVNPPTASPTVDREVLVRRLQDFAQISSIDFISRARRILIENERSVSSMRIITDLRPVYGDNSLATPAGMVIVHNLKIDFLPRGGMRQRESAFFALDDNDVTSLISILRRAEEKSLGLRKFAQQASVAVLSPEPPQAWQKMEE